MTCPRHDGFIPVGFWPTIPGPPPTALERRYLAEKAALMDQDIREAQGVLQAALKAACDPSWRRDNPAEYEAVVAYLSKPDSTLQYRGWSNCRVCGRPNGSQDHFRGKFVFPEGYLHYITDHNFKPPDNLIRAAVEEALS